MNTTTKSAGTWRPAKPGETPGQMLPEGCHCRPKPYVMATWRNSCLVSVARMHNRTRYGAPPPCSLPPEPLNPKDWW